MSNRFSHIDDKFKDAFQQWEAPYTPEEMMGDWQSFSKQLPQTPANPSAPSSPASGGGSGAWGLGKLAAISGVAAVVATTAVIAYNIYKNDNEAIVQNTTGNEPAVVIAEEQPAEITSKSDNNTVVLVPEMMQSPAVPEQDNKDKQSQISTRPDASKEKINNASGNQPKPEVIGTTPGGEVPKPDNKSEKVAPAAANEKVQQEQFNKFTNEVNALPGQICVGDALKFNTHNLPVSATVNWGDGVKGYLNAGSEHIYTSAGTYKLTIQSGDKPVSKVVKVLQAPEAHFSLHQSVDLKCKFKNSSMHAAKYVWDFGDSTAPVTTYNGAEHKYRTSGDRIVTMIAYNEAGCADTTKQKITVSSYGKPEIKTAITPNGDGYNDEMTVIIENETYYSMTIMDLSGRKVFESEDKQIQWNGKYMNEGEMLPPGQYIYSLTYRYEGEGKTRQESGFVIKDPDLLRR